MNKILELLNEREKNYESSTRQVLDSFRKELDKAYQYLLKADLDVNWYSIDLIKENSNFVYIKGYLKVKVGDIVLVSENTKVEVTEEMLRKNPIQILRVMIPISLLDNPDPEKLHKVIKDYMQLNAVISNEDMLKIISDLQVETIGELFENDKALDMITKPKEIAGFNIEGMDEEKIKQIAYYNDKGSKAVN